MEIGSAALAGLFMAMGWALVKTVEFFVKKYGKNAVVQLDNEQTRQLKEIYQQCVLQTRFGALTKNQEIRLKDIEKSVIHLDELHSVYDENHIPTWYVPRGLLSLARSINNDINIMSDDLKEELGRISAGQSISVEKISDLITSQKLVTERLGDLINLWSKVMKNNN